jgi:hypothetical protein
MSDIRRGNHHARHPKRYGLYREHHITVQRLVVTGRQALLMGLRPEYSRLTPRRTHLRESQAQ